MTKTPEEVDAIVDEFKVDFEKLSEVEQQFVAEVFFPGARKANAALNAEAEFYAKQKADKKAKKEAAASAPVDPLDLLGD